MSAPKWRRSVSVKRAKKNRANTWGVELTPQLAKTARDLVERAYPKVGRAVEVEIEQLRDDTFNNWPEKSGFSKASISLRYELLADLYRVSLVVAAPYALFIISKGQRPGQVVLNAAKPLANRLARVIGDKLASE